MSLCIMHYAEWLYAECQLFRELCMLRGINKCFMLSAIMPNVIMLSVIMLNAFIQSVIMMNGFMLRVVYAESRK